MTKMMATIVSVKTDFIKNGILNHESLPHIWKTKELPPKIHPLLLKLLEKFEIIIPFKK